MCLPQEDRHVSHICLIIFIEYFFACKKKKLLSFHILMRKSCLASSFFFPCMATDSFVETLTLFFQFSAAIFQPLILNCLANLYFTGLQTTTQFFH